MIKYRETGSKDLISNLLLLNHEIVFVKLSPNDFKWQILAIDPDYRLVAESTSVSLDKAKENARDKLISLGYVPINSVVDN